VLYIATGLLVMDKISEWIWFAVLVIVMFGVIGLKVLAEWKGK
jgi:nitrate reductase NapE component